MLGTMIVKQRAVAVVSGNIQPDEGWIGYGVSLSLDVLNLTNAKADQITYYYVSRLSGEGADGVPDRHFHPVEPTAVRLTLAGRF